MSVRVNRRINEDESVSILSQRHDCLDDRLASGDYERDSNHDIETTPPGRCPGHRNCPPETEPPAATPSVDRHHRTREHDTEDRRPARCCATNLLFRLQFSNKSFSVNVIDDHSPVMISGQGVATKQRGEYLMVSKTGGEGLEPGELTVQKSGSVLSAYDNVSGPGIPVLASGRGTLVKAHGDDDLPESGPVSATPTGSER